MSSRLVTIFASILVGFLLPAPLTLFSAGMVQGNPGIVLEQTLGQSNLILAYRFSAPFTAVFAIALAVYGLTQCRRPSANEGLLWLSGFPLLGGAFGACALLAFQVAFGGGLFSAADLILHFALGGVAGAVSALPISIVWLIHSRRRHDLDRAEHHLLPGLHWPLFPR